MKEFDELIEIAKILNGPEGCPWDRKQTFESLKTYIIEEAHEVIDAVDEKNDDHIIEELGDLFYTVLFYAKVAEREKRFTIKEILEHVKAKLIHRHPHVFGDEKAESIEEVFKHWDKAKAEEKKGQSKIGSVPKTLPALLRAQKVLKAIHKSKCPKFEHNIEEDKLAHQLLEVVHKANHEGIDLESTLIKLLSKEEQHFRKWEDT